MEPPSMGVDSRVALLLGVPLTHSFAGVVERFTERFVKSWQIGQYKSLEYARLEYIVYRPSGSGRLAQTQSRPTSDATRG